MVIFMNMTVIVTGSTGGAGCTHQLKVLVDLVKLGELVELTNKKRCLTYSISWNIRIYQEVLRGAIVRGC